jgi:zinc protease
MASRQAQKRLAPASYRFIGSYKGFEEYELKKNGLRVLYKHDPSAPVMGLMVTYLVGSRFEAVGHTGATHILEHLMFKGSKRFPKKDGVSALDRLSEKGALVNASTWFDRTNYYEVLPEEHFEYALELEADRMRNALITEKDLIEELPAVRSEYAWRTESEPGEYLEERMWAVAYLAQPYHHSTIGWLADIENVPLTKLQEFYDTYYWPNNAVVTVVGSIERTKALRLLAREFGVHPRSPHTIPEPYTTEPPQYGRRFVEVNRTGTMNIVGVAFKVPEALHADTPAITVLSAILGDGKTARLYRALVETNLASSAWTSYMPFHDPSLMFLYATPADGVAHERVEQVIHDVCQEVVEKGVSRDELRRVLAGIETEMAFARDGHYATLSTLNEAIAVGDWRFLYKLPAQIGKVTASDVKRVAGTYLNELTMTVGHYKATNK